MDYQAKRLLLITFLVINGVFPYPMTQDAPEETIHKIEVELKELEQRVVEKAKEARGEIEAKLWGLHDQLESRVKDLARHLEHECRKKSLTYLSDALDEVEKNGMACDFAKSLANKMKVIEEEAKGVITALRLEAQYLKLKFIPCFNHETTPAYCQKFQDSLVRLSQPADGFIDKTKGYFKGDYERFLLECFDKTAFEMKVQAGIVESQKCKGV